MLQVRDSCVGTIDQLLSEGVSKDKIMAALVDQKIEIVLTAHPTEVNRRTLLNKHRRVVAGAVLQMSVRSLLLFCAHERDIDTHTLSVGSKGGGQSAPLREGGI